MLQSPDLYALLSMDETRSKSEELRDKTAHYYGAYYRELRRQLKGQSFGVATIPSHLMPWKKVVYVVVYVMETRDGHFVTEHVSGPGRTYSDLYEDYLQVVPRRAFTLRDVTGDELEEGTAMRVAPTLIRHISGKQLGDEVFAWVQNGDYLERRDVITRAKVYEWSEEEAVREARQNLQPYLSGPS